MSKVAHIVHIVLYVVKIEIFTYLEKDVKKLNVFFISVVKDYIKF